MRYVNKNSIIQKVGIRPDMGQRGRPMRWRGRLETGAEVVHSNLPIIKPTKLKPGKLKMEDITPNCIFFTSGDVGTLRQMIALYFTVYSYHLTAFCLFLVLVALTKIQQFRGTAVTLLGDRLSEKVAAGSLYNMVYHEVKSSALRQLSRFTVLQILQTGSFLVKDGRFF